MGKIITHYENFCKNRQIGVMFMLIFAPKGKRKNNVRDNAYRNRNRFP